MPEIVTDENNRILTVDGQEKPHITNVLADLGLSKSFEGVTDIEWFAMRGKAIHAACKLINEGTLDESTVSDEIRAYVEAYKSWLHDSSFSPRHSELPLYSTLHDFCGTLDLVGALPGIGNIIIDIKSSFSIDPAVEIQVGAQSILWNENNQGNAISKRYVLQLKKDGTYRFKDLSHVNEFLFLDALRIWKWKMSHKRPKRLNDSVQKIDCATEA
jgi:hypothetical protein